MYSHNSFDTGTAWKKTRFILSERSDFRMIDNLSIVANANARHMLTTLTVDKILLPRYVNLSTSIRGLPFSADLAPWLKTHHHHHIVALARLSLTLSRHFFRSFIASGRSSRLHLVSSHSCCMYVRAGRPAFARPYVGVHRSTSLMSSSRLLQQCLACLVCLTWIVFVMGKAHK